MATKGMSKVNQLSNNNYFIVLLLVSLLVVGGTVLIGKSLVNGIVRDTTVLKKKNIANDQLTKNVNAAPQLIEKYQTLSSRNMIADALPNTSDLPAFMAVMENISGSSGVSLKSISPSQAGAVGTTAVGADTSGAAAASTNGVTPPKPQPYTVSLTFDANYASLGRLLKSIEQSVRPIRVTGLQISGSGATLSIQMDVTTYYQDKASLPFSTETVK